MFEAVYQSSWHHPYLFWLLQGLALGFIALRSRKQLRPLFMGLVLLAALDAWLSANHLSPLKSKELARISSLVFVVLGDARFFVLLDWRNKPEAKRIVRAFALALIVPIASSVAMYTHPGNSRVLFLTYEVMFFFLAATVRFVVLPRHEALNGPWQKTLCHFELVQYALWAGADIVILAGYDMGFLLRILPNLLYYAAFVPVAYFSQVDAKTASGPSGPADTPALA